MARGHGRIRPPVLLPRATRETRWTRPEKTADWISDAVLSAVADARAPAPRQALDTTISLIHGPPGTGKKRNAGRFAAGVEGQACSPARRRIGP